MIMTKKIEYEYLNCYPEFVAINKWGKKGFRFVTFFKLKEGGTLFVLMEKKVRKM